MSQPSRVRHALILDDRPRARAEWAGVLMQAGWAVCGESQPVYGVSAVAEAAACGRPFDVVLVALELIGSDPFAFTANVRQLGFAGAVVALTAADIDPAAAWESGFDGCVSIPAGLGSLPEQVERACKVAEVLAARTRRAADGAGCGHSGVLAGSRRFELANAVI
jgi:DNA-binding response OmpR family regulator